MSDAPIKYVTTFETSFMPLLAGCLYLFGVVDRLMAFRATNDLDGEWHQQLSQDASISSRERESEKRVQLVIAMVCVDA